MDLRQEEINLRLMKTQSTKELTKGALAVAIALSLVLVPYSLLVGWNVVTLLLFWFVIVPWIAVQLPGKVSKNGNHVIESLIGLIIFYAAILFMIYEHYQSDYFLVMMVSCGINLLVVSTISLKRKRAQTA